MYLQWNDSLSTGHPRIDHDHRKLIDVVNRLGDAIARKRGKDLCGAVIDELIKSTKSHFAMEEALMQSLRGRYEQTAAHKAQHAKLVQDLFELEARIRGGSQAIAVPLANSLYEPLLQHIKGSDKPLAVAANSALRPVAAAY